MRSILLSIFLCALLCSSAFAGGGGTIRRDTVTGVINRYARILGIDSCNSSLLIDNPSGFGIGDKVLIIQMKGALINTTNTTNFGLLSSYENAGNYEFGTIEWMQGRSILLMHKLKRQYDLPGLVQLVRVPQYNNVYIKDTVTAQPWNGFTGGIVVLSATDTVKILTATGAMIDVTGKGFRGGAIATKDTTRYAQQLFLYSLSAIFRGGRKGESIAHSDTSYIAGRGNLAGGGGGGNGRSSGGGGGGNYWGGGVGGNQFSRHTALPIGGKGGGALAYSNPQNKIFLGSGGGSAHAGNDSATGGKNGGGIVIIRADVFAGGDIFANGANTAKYDTARGDGAGGGGAGGLILLDVNRFVPGVPGKFVLAVNGGNGSWVKSKPTPTDYCFGPGGGGGSGLVWAKDTTGMALSVANARVVQSYRGNAGWIISGPSSCNMAVYGAGNGLESPVQTDRSILTGLQVPVGTEPR